MGKRKNMIIIKKRIKKRKVSNVIQLFLRTYFGISRLKCLVMTSIFPISHVSFSNIHL